MFIKTSIATVFCLLICTLILPAQDLQDHFLSPQLEELMTLYDMSQSQKDSHFESRGYKDINEKQTPVRMYEKLIEHDENNFSIQTVSFFNKQFTIASFSTNIDAKILATDLIKDLQETETKKITWGKKYELDHNGETLKISLSYIDRKSIIDISAPIKEAGGENAFLDASCKCMEKYFQEGQTANDAQNCLKKLMTKFPIQFSKSMENDQEMKQKLEAHCPSTMQKVKEKMR